MLGIIVRAESAGGNRVNVRVSLIAMGALGLAVGLALAEPAGPATAKPFPATVFALAAQAASQLPASPATTATSAAPDTPKVPQPPAGYPLLLGTGANQGWPLP